MIEGKDFLVLELDELTWPLQVVLPMPRFRLFIAADASAIPDEAIQKFSASALEHGMVYCSCWGVDCERVHDCIDGPLVRDELGARRFVGPNLNDVIMTTWHTREGLREALWFFAKVTTPSEGLLPGSNFRLAIVIRNHEWAATAYKYLRRCKEFSE